MKKIVIASTNPVKITASLQGFQRMFPEEEFITEGITVSSQVADQPMTDEETFQGALNRASNAMKSIRDADYYVGIEGGVEEKKKEMEAFAWIIIKDKKGRIGKARTGTFFLPSQITRLIKQGVELGTADDMVFKHTNTKQKMGSVGILTDNCIDRTDYYTHAVILALIPFKNEQLY
jgi:inosine/xanthosine triphosphatase